MKLRTEPAHEAPQRGDVLEAEVRRRMARLTPVRGFDTARKREAEMASIDALLDEWNRTTR